MAQSTRSSNSGSRAASNRSSVSNPSPHLQQDDFNDADDEHPSYEDDESMADDLEDPESPSAFYSNTAQQLLEPLQQTAERVSRQVEDFARCLDRYNTTRASTDQSLWDDAWTLLENFNTIAIKRRDRVRADTPGRRSSSQKRRILGDTRSEEGKVQFEADLWALAHDMLLSSSPKEVEDVGIVQQTALSELTRYSTNAEIWSAFLDSDLAAQECEAVLTWLQDRWQALAPPVDEIIAPVLAKAERGQGVWSSSAIYTKNLIKAQKRSRSWSRPLGSSIPGIGTAHKRTTDDVPFVTQLDPDSTTRESAVLHPQDEFHEQAAWQACWELLRRGGSQQDLEGFWLERKEPWRFAVLRANDAFMARGSNLDKSPWLRIMNIVTNHEWYKTCQLLCQQKKENHDYATAVYGLLCGDVPTSVRVCRTIDDHLFCIFNAMLIARYRRFIQAYRQKIQDHSKPSYSPPPADYARVRTYLHHSQKADITKEESHDPLRCIEGVLMCKDLNAFFIQIGQAAAQVAHSSGESAHLITADEGAPSNEMAQIVAQDPDSVRIVAHLQLLYRTLGFIDEAYDTVLYTVENNIVSYIGWLQREMKLDLIPMYASMLSSSRIPRVLGAILIDITEQKERDYQVRLMKQYHISVPDVLVGIAMLANRVEILKFRQADTAFTAQRITELVGTAKFKTLRIRAGFMSEDIEEQEELAIRSAEWYRYVDNDNWGKACFSISTMYKIFFFNGKLSAARDLVQRANLTDLSLAALGINARIVDMLSPNEEVDVQMDGMPRDEEKSINTPKRRRDHPLTQPGTTREVVASQALVWSQLEQLVVALDALERWCDIADEVDRNRNNSSQLKLLKKALRETLSDVQESMEPLFDEDFLTKPNDEAESRTLTEIRKHYLPECLLAYTSVLFFAGHAISRSYLVECMNLAQTVATVKNLTQAFVEGKRMREFVDAMAWASQGMIEASELGNSGKASANKGEREKDAMLGLWNVKWDAGQLADLDIRE